MLIFSRTRVSEELSSVETLIFILIPILAFVIVSEELSSVETERLLSICRAVRYVSEELSSVET